MGTKLNVPTYCPITQADAAARACVSQESSPQSNDGGTGSI